MVRVFCHNTISLLNISLCFCRRRTLRRFLLVQKYYRCCEFHRSSYDRIKIEKNKRKKINQQLFVRDLIRRVNRQIFKTRAHVAYRTEFAASACKSLLLLKFRCTPRGVLCVPGRINFRESLPDQLMAKRGLVNYPEFWTSARRANASYPIS